MFLWICLIFTDVEEELWEAKSCLTHKQDASVYAYWWITWILSVSRHSPCPLQEGKPEIWNDLEHDCDSLMHSKNPVENKGNTKPCLKAPTGALSKVARKKPNDFWLRILGILCSASCILLWSLSKIFRKTIRCRTALYYLLMYSPYRRMKPKR